VASSSKKKTTMAKIMRENAVRERQARKAAKKDARKQLAEDVRNGVVVIDDTDGADEAVTQD
jgi:hypothetical protein